MPTLSPKAQKLRAIDLRAGIIPLKIQRSMEEDKDFLSIINALYEMMAQSGLYDRD